MRRNLIVVRAGDRSHHPHWLGAGERDFDLFVSYYGKIPGQFRGKADHYEAGEGPRWPAHDRLCRERWDLLGAYDYIAFVADDVKARQSSWDDLFAICRRYALDLAQPAVKGPVSHQITRPQAGCVLRYTNFVEIMCPVFSRASLALLRDTFGESVSGWGLDFLWPKHLPYPRHRMAIVDAIRVRHSRAPSTLAPVLAGLGISAQQELDRLLALHGLTMDQQEHGRVAAEACRPWRRARPKSPSSQH